MSIMITEIYEALVEAGASEEKAKAAAEVVPDDGGLATKTDLSNMEGRLFVWMASLHLATLAMTVISIKLL